MTKSLVFHAQELKNLEVDGPPEMVKHQPLGEGMYQKAWPPWVG